MTRIAAALLACAAGCAQAQAQAQTQAPTAGATAAPGPAILRLPNLADGAPAFELRDERGRRVGRIECIANGWYESDAMAVRLLASPAVMAALIAKGGRIAIEDLGPATFNCVVVRAPATP